MTKFGHTNDKRLIRQRIEDNARASGRLPEPRPPAEPERDAAIVYPDEDQGQDHAFGEWLGHVAAGRIAVR